MTSLLSLPPRLDIAAKFTTEARYAGFFDADNRYYGKYSTNYVFYCLSVLVKESANKQVISSQADSLIKISRIWADFFPANTSNQPI